MVPMAPLAPLMLLKAGLKAAECSWGRNIELLRGLGERAAAVVALPLSWPPTAVLGDADCCRRYERGRRWGQVLGVWSGHRPCVPGVF